MSLAKAFQSCKELKDRDRYLDEGKKELKKCQASLGGPPPC